ncbi:MAG: FAD-dependent oxidoreductase [Thermoplasmata archaeon]|nr:FAD-dependent oxidoreductase [Thermoplasmata archaeon]
MPAYDVAVVGAGVVGLAIARAFAQDGASVVVLERQPGPGREQSTHNSGVVHSGAFTRPGTLRARLAVEGNRRMFDEAPRLGVAIERCGTLVVARVDADVPRLWEYERWAAANAVDGVQRLGSSEAKEIEPALAPCAAALWVTSGGRIDAAGLVRALDNDLARLGADRRFDFDLASALRGDSGWTLSTRLGESVEAELVVNSAGVRAARVAGLFGSTGHRVYPCLGEYARVVGEKRSWLRTMVYGFPPPGYPGIGVHLTRTTSGDVLIGPTATYIDSMDPPPLPHTSLATFAELASAYLPGLTERDLEPAGAGVRAKTVPPGSGEAFGEFEIVEEPPGSGVVHLFGFESPGLTASFATADHVRAHWPVGRT